MVNSNLRGKRRGVVYIEAAIATALILSTLAVVAQLIGFASRQRHDADQRRIAIQEAGNLLERALALPWEELNEEAAQFSISPGSAERLQEPQVRIGVSRVDGGSIPAKRIQVAVSWIDRSGLRVSPVQLTAWKHSSSAASVNE